MVFCFLSSCGNNSCYILLIINILIFQISDEQFRWLLIEPLVQSRNWDDLEFIMLKKKSLSRRMEVTIPTDRFILHLNSLGVPNNIIESYLKYLSDDEFIQIVIRLNMVDEAVKVS
ncbi:uncharacterized protein DC041_0009872 [Schistosoma bovis]|uniref:Uncharacterized protein n=1 Tax=Schistosoma bovis TaxID=6184 RepID=A0A430PY24_SCHBO|nr:uncharacterized protein DC041_0009872 [Schistosoma bovis]